MLTFVSEIITTKHEIKYTSKFENLSTVLEVLLARKYNKIIQKITIREAQNNE